MNNPYLLRISSEIFTDEMVGLEWQDLLQNNPGEGMKGVDMKQDWP